MKCRLVQLRPCLESRCPDDRDFSVSFVTSQVSISCCGSYGLQRLKEMNLNLRLCLNITLIRSSFSAEDKATVGPIFNRVTTDGLDCMLFHTDALLMLIIVIIYISVIIIIIISIGLET